MGLPKQVEDAANEAEEYIKSLNEAEESETDTEEASSTEDETSETEDQHEEETSTEEEEAKEDFEAKYNTLQGKYNAEVPRLHEELKELKASVFEKLEGLIEEKDTEPQEQEKEVEKNPLLDAFREEYGDDLMKYLDAYFESKLPNVTDQVSDAVKPVEEKVSSLEESQIEAAQIEFAEALDNSVNGEWREAWAGNDPKFTEFLEQTDPSGLYTNAELADLYSKNWDAEKLSKLMNMYYGEPESPKEQEESKEKEALVAPSKKSTVTKPIDSGDKKIWTPESIKQFEKDDRRGKYTPDESKALWEDLLSAPSENRIR